MDIQVNGKRVTLRDKVEARYFDDLLSVVEAMNDKTRKVLSIMPVPLRFDELYMLGKMAVESWEMDGDPKERESWARLDLPTEYLPLLKGLTDWLGDKFNPPKNS